MQFNNIMGIILNSMFYWQLYAYHYRVRKLPTSGIDLCKYRNKEYAIKMIDGESTNAHAVLSVEKWKI